MFFFYQHNSREKKSNAFGRILGFACGILLSTTLKLPGIFGLIIGYWLGHKFDRALHQFTQGQHRFASSNATTKKQFIHSCFYILGTVSKKAGTVKPQDINFAQQLIATLKLNRKQQKIAKDAFSEGKSHNDIPHAIIEKFNQSTYLKQKLRQQLNEILYKYQAHCQLTPQQQEMLQQIMQLITPHHYQHQAQNQWQQFYQNAWQQTQQQDRQNQHHQWHEHYQQAKHQPTHTLAWAHQTLGVTNTTPLDEIKKSYRRLISKHHPDRAESEDQVKQHTKKTHELNRAWKIIQQTHH